MSSNVKKKVNIIADDIKILIIRMATPMVFGMLGLIIFNLVDTYFVSKLGVDNLAAISFTFPVVLVINSVALGIGLGTASTVSRAIGKEDDFLVKRLATDSLILGVLVVLIFVVIGLFTIEPLFNMLGATEEVMPLIKTYMSIWYLGMMFVVIPMIGNNTIRALGDTLVPSIIMLVAAVVNTILDPILIFGFGVIPGMGIAGAAIATVIARMITFSVAIYILGYRERLISFSGMTMQNVMYSFRSILYIGLPNAFSKMIEPMSFAFITGLLAVHGIKMVAGFGIAIKVQSFATIVLVSISVVMIPIVGQNFGAKKMARVKESIKASYGFSIVLGLFSYILLSFIAEPLSGVFSKDPVITEVFAKYIKVVSLTYGMYGIMRISISILNAINKPYHAIVISLTQMFVVCIPLSIVGSKYFGYIGVFYALATSYVVGSLLGVLIIRNYFTNNHS